MEAKMIVLIGLSTIYDGIIRLSLRTPPGHHWASLPAREPIRGPIREFAIFNHRP